MPSLPAGHHPSAVPVLPPFPCGGLVLRFLPLWFNLTTHTTVWFSLRFPVRTVVALCLPTLVLRFVVCLTFSPSHHLILICLYLSSIQTFLSDKRKDDGEGKVGQGEAVEGNGGRGRLRLKRKQKRNRHAHAFLCHHQTSIRLLNLLDPPPQPPPPLLLNPHPQALRPSPLGLSSFSSHLSLGLVSLCPTHSSRRASPFISLCHHHLSLTHLTHFCISLSFVCTRHLTLSTRLDSLFSITGTCYHFLVVYLPHCTLPIPYLVMEDLPSFTTLRSFITFYCIILFILFTTTHLFSHICHYCTFILVVLHTLLP